MRTKKLVSSLAAAGLLALAATPAAAALTWFFPITAFQDDNIDFVVDTNDNDTIDVGDRLISVVEFVNTQGILAGQGPNTIQPPELTGVADVTVTGISLDGNLIFGPSGAAGVLSGFAAGTAVALWTDPIPDLNVNNAACGTQANCMMLAGLGELDGSTLWATAGFFGDPDEFWVSAPETGGTDILTVQGGGSSVKFASFNFALSLGENNTGREFGQQACAPFCNPLAIGGDGMVDIIGSGDILGGQGLDPVHWTARSDADFQLVPIPEPGSLALLGLALAGAGLVRFRRRPRT